MWIWIFGFSISLFLTLHELNFSILVSLFPLILICIIGFIEMIFSITKYFDKTNYNVKVIDIIETVYTWSITVITIILIYLQLIDAITFDLFFMLMLICLFVVSGIYMLVGGYHQLFMNMNVNMRVANILTFITTLSTYLTFYGVENNMIARWVPLIPFTSSLMVEIYIVYILRQGSNDLNSKFSDKVAKDRIFYSVCIGTLFIVSIIHYIIDGIDIIIYVCSTLLYLFGIVFLSFDMKTKLCLRLRCFKQPKWQQLKGDELYEGNKT